MVLIIKLKYLKFIRWNFKERQVTELSGCRASAQNRQNGTELLTVCFGPDQAVDTEPSMTATELSQKYSEQVPVPATAGSVTNGERRHKYYIIYSVFVLYVQ